MDNNKKSNTKKGSSSIAPNVANDQLGENSGIDMDVSKRSSDKKPKQCKR